MATTPSASARPEYERIKLPCACARKVVSDYSDMFDCIAWDAMVMSGGDDARARQLSAAAWDARAAIDGNITSAAICELTSLPWEVVLEMAFKASPARLLVLWGMYLAEAFVITHEPGCQPHIDVWRISPN